MPSSLQPSQQFDVSQLRAIEKRLVAEKSRRDDLGKLEGKLADFVAGAWSSMDPAPYVRGWAPDALCEHLQAVAEGEIQNLLVNYPPRCGKTNIGSVAFPAWSWARGRKHRDYLNGPQVRFLCGSYNNTLALQNSNLGRRLVQSEWYQARWGERFDLTQDQNAKSRFDNDAGGSRIATSVGGSLLGIGGDIIIPDDPHNVNDVESDVERESSRNWVRELVSTRRNDPKRSPVVIIMQRLHQEDVSGLILSGELGEFVHLMIPMRYDESRSCVTVIGWEDPREEPGELMWPERYDEPEVATMESALGPYMSSGRLQQSPEPTGGGIFKREWWQLWGNPDDPKDPEFKKFPQFSYTIAYLDTAYTEKEENDPSALTVWGLFQNMHGVNNVMMAHAWSKRLELNDLVLECAKTCRRFKIDLLLIEAKAAGMPVYQELRRLFPGEGWAVRLDQVEKDKVARAYSVQHLFSDGYIWTPDREWADMVIDQCAVFPKGANDDLVDTTTGALRYFRKKGLLTRGDERTVEVAESRKFRSISKPLYPGARATG